MSWFYNKQTKSLFQIFAHEGFVKACPVGWIPTTRYDIEREREGERERETDKQTDTQSHRLTEKKTDTDTEAEKT